MLGCEINIWKVSFWPVTLECFVCFTCLLVYSKDYSVLRDMVSNVLIFLVVYIYIYIYILYIYTTKYIYIYTYIHMYAGCNLYTGVVQ